MARNVTVSGTAARRQAARTGGSAYPRQSALANLGLYYRAVEDGDLPPLPMPWISPPSRFLGAKGATRPRPLSGRVRTGRWGSAEAAPGRQPGSSCVDCPVEVLDTIRSLGLNAAGQELLLGANLRRIMRL